MNKLICTRWALASTFALLAGCSRNSLTTAPQSSRNLPLTKTQVLGVDLMKALQNDSRLAKSSISVGTSNNTVTLDGQVANASAKIIAFQIAKDKAPSYSILNRLVVSTTSLENEKLKKRVITEAAQKMKPLKTD